MPRRKKPQPETPTASVPPTPERAAQARAAGLDIEVAEPERTARGGAKAFTDAEGKPSRPWRVIDTLAAMERAGSINADQRATGERFRALYEIAGRAGAPAVRLEPRSDGGDPMSAVERRVQAGRALARVAEVLHAPGPLHSIVVDVVGLGMPLAAWDELHRVRKGRASLLVSEALGILSREW